MSYRCHVSEFVRTCLVWINLDRWEVGLQHIYANCINAPYLSKIAVVRLTDLVSHSGKTFLLRIDRVLWLGNSPLTLSPWRAEHHKKKTLVFKNSSQFLLSCCSQSLLRKGCFRGGRWAAVYTCCDADVQEHKNLWRAILQAAYTASQAASTLLPVFQKPVL